MIYLQNQLLNFENLEKIKMFYQEREMDGICSESKKILKKRAKYNKINDEIRLKLIDAVEKDGELLKSAAKRLNVNYSSAKSIFQTYRKEGRLLRKTNKIRQFRAVKSVIKKNEDKEVGIEKIPKLKDNAEARVLMTSTSLSTNAKNEIFGYDSLENNFYYADNLLKKMNEEKLRNSLLLRSIMGGLGEVKPMTNNHLLLNTQYIYQNNHVPTPPLNSMEEFQYIQNLRGLM